MYRVTNPFDRSPCTKLVLACKVDEARHRQDGDDDEEEEEPELFVRLVELVPLKIDNVLDHIPFLTNCIQGNSVMV